MLAAGDEIMRLCIDAGGSLTGEHGVGLEKLRGMEHLFGPEDLRAMCRVRDVWDPERRMNPGKLLPVRACGELRGAGRPAGRPAQRPVERPGGREGGSAP